MNDTTTQRAFAASVAGVRSRFRHLAEEDIAHPPIEWPDAKLARQIATHLAVEAFGASGSRLAEELNRSRSAVSQALRTVRERLSDETFAEAYAEMEEAARIAKKDAAHD